jgi:hypothetical protein
MTQGASGTFAVFGTNISQPTSGRWSQRSQIGTDGNNKPVYPTVRDFEMAWNLMPTSELKTIIDYSLASQTGTLVVDLPKWGDANYIFYSYSGTVSEEPSVGEYFSGYVLDVKWNLTNIRTN